jgi:hypothetical protein
MKRSYLLFMLTFALVFYVLGASYVEGFVNYRTWPLIGADEFTAYHQALTPRIVAFLVIPGFAITALTLWLLWFRPPVIPRWVIIVSLALSASVIIISSTVQIPIQRELSQNGLNQALIEKLIWTDWFRKLPLTANALLFLWMMSKVLSTSVAAVHDKT